MIVNIMVVGSILGRENYFFLFAALPRQSAALSFANQRAMSLCGRKAAPVCLATVQSTQYFLQF